MNKEQYNKTSQFIGSLLIIVLVMLGACRKDDSDIILTNLDDWSEETHSNTADPNYELVFDHGEVIRFDIVIDPDDWSDMQADLDCQPGFIGRKTRGRHARCWWNLGLHSHLGPLFLLF